MYVKRNVSKFTAFVEYFRKSSGLNSKIQSIHKNFTRFTLSSSKRITFFFVFRTIKSVFYLVDMYEIILNYFLDKKAIHDKNLLINHQHFNKSLCIDGTSFYFSFYFDFYL